MPEVQFRRGLGTRIRPAMALMVVSPARRLSANCCRLRHMRQASLRLSNEGIGSARFTKECHVKARNLALGFGPSAITTTATLGQNFRSCGRRPIPLPAASVRHNHFTPAGMERRRSSASSAELALTTESLAEHAFAYTLLDCIIVDEEHVRHDTTRRLRAHDRRAHAVRPMFVSLTPTAGAGRGSAHELRARPATSVHFPGRILVRAAPRVRKRGDGFLLPG